MTGRRASVTTQPAIYFSIIVMALFVVTVNRVFWRRLYDLAERKFKLD